MRPFTARRATGLLIALLVVVIDQTTKMAAAHGAPAGFVPRNPAYAFGIVGGSAPMLILGAVLVLGAFLVIADALAVRFGISVLMPALVAGGTIGNTLDRVRLGSVRDFLVTPWAIVNFADFAVALGIVGLAILLAAQAPKLRTQPFATTAR
jgi:signal peptidase II